MGDAQLNTVERFREQTLAVVRERGLMADVVDVVSVRPLTPDEAIGKPERTDFPLFKGKEFMMEARYHEARGQAFTSMPGSFGGTLADILERDLKTDFDRALVVATANAVLAHLGIAEKTVHCRDQGPKQCAGEIVAYISERYGTPKIAFIGCQPALIEALSGHFEMRVTDMDPNNIGQRRWGVVIESAETASKVIEWADIVLVTGTTLANDTIDEILSDKPTIFYGVTSAGWAAMSGLERYCPYAE